MHHQCAYCYFLDERKAHNRAAQAIAGSTAAGKLRLIRADRASAGYIQRSRWVGRRVYSGMSKTTWGSGALRLPLTLRIYPPVPARSVGTWEIAAVYQPDGYNAGS